GCQFRPAKSVIAGAANCRDVRPTLRHCCSRLLAIPIARSGIQSYLTSKAPSRRDLSVVPSTSVAAKHFHFVCQVASCHPPTVPQSWDHQILSRITEFASQETDIK